jgi:hypothetical protein
MERAGGGKPRRMAQTTNLWVARTMGEAPMTGVPWVMGLAEAREEHEHHRPGGDCGDGVGGGAAADGGTKRRGR